MFGIPSVKTDISSGREGVETLMARSAFKYAEPPGNGTWDQPLVARATTLPYASLSLVSFRWRMLEVGRSR
jgi:hypothetical protein